MTIAFHPHPSLPGCRARFIGSGQYRRRAYGRNHPLSIPRVPLAFDLINAYGAITPEEYIPARKAVDFELEWFHTRAYVSAIKRAEVLGQVKQAYRERHQLGTLENPFFDQLYTTPATATGASIQAAEAVLAGTAAFNPAGGMHHARPDHAAGFGFFNDVVIAIRRLRQAGRRVLYIDIDAHHGDGVEEAFLDDGDVLTLSTHMDTGYAYPRRGGRLEDRGRAESGFTTFNLPLPRDVSDAEYLYVLGRILPEVAARFRPDAVVLQAGTDMIRGDPVGKWRLATQTFLEAARMAVAVAPRTSDGTPLVMATGGGGYHPVVVARAWAGLWAILSARSLPEALPEEGARLLREVGWEDDEDGDESDPDGRYVSRLDRASGTTVRPELAGFAEQALLHPFLR